MRRNEIIGAADAVADVAGLVTDTTRDMHLAIAGRGFAHAARWLGPLVRPVRTVHEVVAAATYATVRAGLATAIGVGGRVVARRRPVDGPSVLDSARGGRTVATVNGIVGDRLARQDNPLSLPMTLRHNGADLPSTRAALAGAHPHGTPGIAVFVPGLCETEAAWGHRADEWHPDGAATHGTRLQQDLGLTPLWVRYNTGRRVSDNGADLGALMAAVTRHWPVPVEQIVLVGYSMGGLVARSALHAADGADWSTRVTHVVTLASPHHGTPLEKLGNAATWGLGRFDQTAALAAFFNNRSAGIKDLRYGNVGDADWRGHDPDALLRDTRVTTPPPVGVAHHAVGASIGGQLGHLLGDGMVRLPSATGRHRHRPLPFQGRVALRGLGHVALRNHPDVYASLRDILVDGTPPAARQR